MKAHVRLPLLVHNTNLHQYCTVSKLLRIIGQISTFERGGGGTSL